MLRQMLRDLPLMAPVVFLVLTASYFIGLMEPHRAPTSGIVASMERGVPYCEAPTMVHSIKQLNFVHRHFESLSEEDVTRFTDHLDPFVVARLHHGNVPIAIGYIGRMTDYADRALPAAPAFLLFFRPDGEHLCALGMPLLLRGEFYEELAKTYDYRR